MKKMNVYLVFFGLFLGQNLCAQNYASEDSASAKKHEFSMDFAPMLSLMNIEMSESGFYFSYKYNMEKIKLRAAVTSRSRNRFQNQYEFSQFNLGDSVLRIKDERKNISRDFLHLGIETEKEGRLIDLYGGADLLLGATYESYFSTTREYHLNDEGMFQLSLADDLNPIAVYTDYLSIGICPFAGADLNINEVLSIGIMVPAYFYYSFPISSDEEEMPDGRLDFHENIQFTLTVKL